VTHFKLRYVDRFKDRHGHWRYYYRPNKGPRIALPAQPGTPEFIAAYQAAAQQTARPIEPAIRGSPGTFDRLAHDYYQSTNYLRLGSHTQHVYRLVIERLLRDAKIGSRLVSQMTAQHVHQILAKRAATPGAANDVLKKIRILIHFAIDNGWRRDDPTDRIKTFAEGEFHTWTDQEIELYEKKWPVGTKARTAFALLLYTGQRLADVGRMAWTENGFANRFCANPYSSRHSQALPNIPCNMDTTRSSQVVHPYIDARWFTPDYKKWFRRLEQSLIAWNAPYFTAVPKAPGCWEANTCLEPRLILDAMRRHSGKTII
jgi:hypothetical protein